MPVAPPPRRILFRDPLREGTGMIHTIPVGATALRSRACKLACANGAVRPSRVAPSPRTPCLLVTSNHLSTSR
ncbi:hypothetical protein [Dictyobacter vulcani]|uniref:hypothetical protein n=1 Tax=Dictyobacter vulcani TaxID=2607529 RepID=UPI00125011E7|nr:hypothetical protein [Dictyobacter vulcani]